MRRAGKVAIGSAGLLTAGAAILGGRRVAQERALTRLERSLLALPAAGRFDEEAVEALPEAARRYLLHAIAPGTSLASVVRLGTLFSMKLKPDARGLIDLPGRETLAPPRGFVWKARARMGLLPVRVEDHYAAGKGAVNVWALGVLPVARSRGPDVDRSARGRLAIEAIWLPSALLPGREVSWEGISNDRARVTLTLDGEEMPLTLTVDEGGSLREVTTLRHGDVGVDRWQLIPYGVEVEEEATFEGYTIPTRLRGGWWFGTERYDPAGADILRVLGASFG
jgi:hypothetical protein